MGSRRSIIKIDETKCTGCGQCVPNCPEGAMQIIDGKARLVSDLFCDGLGACMGHCPEGAIAVEEREAEPYDERKVMANVVEKGANVIKAHLTHLKEHGATEYHKQAIEYLKEAGIPMPPDEPDPSDHGHSGCPGAAMMDLKTRASDACCPGPVGSGPSRLRNWPVQITLVSPHAPYLQGADLLIVADCVPVAYSGFHEDLLKGKVALVGCPKLDDADAYEEKLTQLFAQNEVRSITCAHMEVPCCFGLVRLVKKALQDSNKDIPFEDVTLSIKGEKMRKA